ncbi:MAG: hypothetical protein HRU70_13840 [Phycisphaeraceae bacterium]|nr:MAG: hypothetical protein HRU70_13840 [Phycisphaeraceae bacterium]
MVTVRPSGGLVRSAAILGLGVFAAGEACGQCALTPVRLQHATATWTQQCAWWWAPAYVVDGNPFTAWALGNCFAGGDETAGEALVFETARDTAPLAHAPFRFTLFSGQYHPCCGGGMTTVGRFRISVTRDHRDTFADGMPVLGTVDADWSPLVPSLARAFPANSNGTLRAGPSPVLTVLPGGVVVASGPNPEFAFYELIADAPFGRITGVRIDFLDDNAESAESDDFGLGTGGPGRHANGNVILREFTMEAAAGPTILVEPADDWVCAGGSATLSVAADTPGATFQWLRDGVPVTGADGPSLTISAEPAAFARDYQCVVATPCGVALSRVARVIGCPVDLTCDGFLDAMDLAAFTAAFQGGLPAADMDGDGFIDFFDFGAFIDLYEAGCGP